MVSFQAEPTNAVLDWTYERAGVDVERDIDISPFILQRGLALDVGFSLAQICEDQGLAVNEFVIEAPRIRLTPAGLSHVQERRKRRDDPALRATAARNGLLQWMYRQHVAGVHMPLPARFTAEGSFEGSRFTDHEIGLAADYLARRDLIKGPRGWGANQPGPLRATITPNGEDCVVDWNSEVSRYLRRQEASSTFNGPVIHGDVDGAQLAWNNQSVIQNNQVQQIAAGYEPLAKAIAELASLLPAMELPPEAHEDVAAAAGEVLAEVTRDEPRAGPIRRALTVLRTCFASIAAAGSRGVSDGAQEATRRAIELITPF